MVEGMAGNDRCLNPNRKKLFLFTERTKGKSFNRLVENLDEIYQFVYETLGHLKDWEIRRQDFAIIPFREQVKL